VNKNAEIIERITGSEKRHSVRQTDLIKIYDHSLSLYVHFDLKGAAPKVSYFEKLFPLLHKWGVTGICMEYEDMFPFDGIVSSIKHKQAYTKEDIEQINQLAKDNHLDVMPLLQTYGK
jgi:hexosaminidase